MDRVSLTQRIVGGIVVLSLAVIFIPLLFDRTEPDLSPIQSSNIPQMPDSVATIVFRKDDEGIFQKVEESSPKPKVDEQPTQEPEPEPVDVEEAPMKQRGTRPSELKTLAEKPAPEAKPKPEPKPAPKPAPKQTSKEVEKPAKPVEKKVVEQAKPKSEPVKAAESKPRKDRQVSEKNPLTWMIQLGSFSNEVNANKLRDELRAKKYPSFVVTREKNDGKIWKVRVGPEFSQQKAEALAKELEKVTGLKTLVVAHR